jgi:hypothetical protein
LCYWGQPEANFSKYYYTPVAAAALLTGCGIISPSLLSE